MALLVLLLSLALMVVSGKAQNPPSPGYYPTSSFSSMSFYQGYAILWGPQHLSVAEDQSSLTIWLDSTSGSGFKSTQPFQSGFFSAAIKLPTGYTAGVITAFYLSNGEAYPGQHDEVDIEFLGTIPGKPYTLQTNVYINGSGDKRIIGREMKFHLWFDPTTDFHNYAILWSPTQIIFFVDDIPIRRYPRKSPSTFPARPMWVYGSIWDASSWATDDGKYKADYRYQPFVANFKRFIIRGCPAYAAAGCHPVSASPYKGGDLSHQQNAAMQWAQGYYMVYNYCKDPKRDQSVLPDCWSK